MTGVRVRKIMLIQSFSGVRAARRSMMTPPRVASITPCGWFVFATSVLAAALAGDETATTAGRARALLERGEAAAASALLEPAVARAPKSAELHYLLAKSYAIEAKQSSNAVRLMYVAWNIGTELETAVALDPSRTDARLDLIRYYELTPPLLGGNTKKAHSAPLAPAEPGVPVGPLPPGYPHQRQKGDRPA